jgi:glutamate 5-kinase
VPIVNENDAIADDAIRFGDNDRIAALVAQLLSADRLVLLTDMPGLYTADPRTNPDAELIAEITSLDDDMRADVTGAGTARGSGGMASKVAAARMAAHSGITTVIAGAEAPDVLKRAISEAPNPGTIVRPHGRSLSAKKLWIGFAVEAAGIITVDAGARKALEQEGASLLTVGVSGVAGHFGVGDPVDIVDTDGQRFARGLSQLASDELETLSGVRSDQHPHGTPDEVVHRDELVVL